MAAAIIVLLLGAVVWLLLGHSNNDKTSSKPTATQTETSGKAIIYANKDGSPLQTVNANTPGVTVQLSRLSLTKSGLTANFKYVVATTGMAMNVASDQKPCSYGVLLDLAHSYVTDTTTNQQLSPAKDRSGNVLATVLPANTGSCGIRVDRGKSVSFSVTYQPPTQGDEVTIGLPFAESFSPITLQ